MVLRIARVHYPITVLGPGRRLGLWVQGCSIGCGGCMSRDTWNSNAGKQVATGELIDFVAEVMLTNRLDGITLSGGEPLDQAEGVRKFLTALRAELRTTDVMMYSGFSLSQIRRRHPWALKLVDALVSGPYVQGSRPTHPWVGSSNQRLTITNPRLAKRYLVTASRRGGKRLQVSVDEVGLWVTGIPEPQDLVEMERILDVRGLTLEQVSWR